jgi:predicted DNA-binding transcriptional regulator YafY
VGRIEEWKITSDKFKRDPEFSIAKYLGTAFQAERGGEVVDVFIRFDRQAARYIREKKWHETQQIEELEGGGLILRFQTGGLGEVKRWVLQYGGNAEVIAPENLKKDIILELGKMKVLYEGFETSV